uniref:Site-specific DNA-methyltransferase (Adenine-specific) n=1 Tax=Magnetococcus massalia (strain MO-1) TaxID=451514 RepID=A0A1S7LNJ3_MAGMO|nr:Site-specific DNA-methyltransferase (adenine-specific) [Candidatus Magnetococcus massalia]
MDYDNGLQSPELEAEYLVAHTIAKSLDEIEKYADFPLSDELQCQLSAMVERRINQRTPVLYLTQEAYFAGFKFYVDERVLIPRSRIENILDDPDGLHGLMEGHRPLRRALDLCTGSGCLAISMALLYPGLKVDAADLSKDALAVAKKNCKIHKTGHRVRLVESDLFQNLKGSCYDLIVTNPPYVPTQIYDDLKEEYMQEPKMALEAGGDGLDLVLPILQQAADFLEPGGVLLCEVGDDTEEIMQKRWPNLPIEWLMFHFGGSGVFATTREQLLEWDGS